MAALRPWARVQTVRSRSRVFLTFKESCSLLQNLVAKVLWHFLQKDPSPKGPALAVFSGVWFLTQRKPFT